MNVKPVSNRFSRNPRILPYVILLLVYFFCRILFQQFTVLKAAFIYPAGLVVELFYGYGNYIDQEWLFIIGQTQFVFGESCSGTTFFSLLVAYIAFRMMTHRTSFVWLLLCYPIALAANAMRVLSSINAHSALALFNAAEFADHAHVVTGSIAFLCSFLLIAYIIEKPKSRLQNEI